MPFSCVWPSKGKFLNDQHYRVCLRPPLRWAELLRRVTQLQKKSLHRHREEVVSRNAILSVTVQRYSSKDSSEIYGLGFVWTDFLYSTAGFCPGCLRFSCSWLRSGCPTLSHWRHRQTSGRLVHWCEHARGNGTQNNTLKENSRLFPLNGTYAHT